jgi:hypothetical protein
MSRRVVIDSASTLHGPIARHWAAEEARFVRETRHVPNRLQRLEARLQARTHRQGDVLVARVKDTFHNGFGLKFGDDQIRVFNAFLASCLPLIYGETWPEEKTRVLKEWGLSREQLFSLVNMARRNGKTFVTSATAAALLLCIPNIKIAIFSTCRRTSQMMVCSYGLSNLTRAR